MDILRLGYRVPEKKNVAPAAGKSGYTHDKHRIYKRDDDSICIATIAPGRKRMYCDSLYYIGNKRLRIIPSVNLGPCAGANNIMRVIIIRQS